MRRRNCPTRDSYAPAVRATTRSPEVSLSRRCTMPGRSAAPTPASSGWPASRPWTRVAVALPAPGWTTSPAGLSTTITASSSCTTVTATDSSGAGRPAAGGISSGQVIPAPAATLVEPFVTTVPSTATTPAAMSAVARARVAPSSVASARSSRSPASAPGTTARTSAGAGRRLRADEHEQQPADHERRIGNVEDRPPLQIDEVDDPAAEETGAVAQHAVGEVADRAAEQQPEAHRTGPIAHRPAECDQHQDHDDGDDGDQPAAAAADAERRAGVAHEV